MGRAVLRQRLLAQEGVVLNVPENLAKPDQKQQLIDFLKPHLEPHPEAKLEANPEANLEVAAKEESTASVEQ